MKISNQPEVLALADRLANLKETYKADCDAVMDDAEAAEVDKPGLRRLVSWRGKEAAKRAEQEAIDDQYRFLAGDRPTPAVLPPDCELAKAIALYRADHSVRQVADTLDVSVGKAQKLRTLAKAFDVHFPVNVNEMNAPAVEMHADDLGAIVIGKDDDAREMTLDDLGDPLLVIDRSRAEFKAKVRAIASTIKPQPKIVLVAPVEDDLAFPAHLRRVRA